MLFIGKNLTILRSAPVHSYCRNAWTCPEEINRLDEARVIVTASFVHSCKDRGFSALFRCALREFTDPLSKGLEQSPFHIGNCGKSAVGQISVPHVTCATPAH